MSKVKLLPGGGMTVEYQLTEVNGGEPSVVDYNATHTRTAHPDLLQKFNALRPIFGRVFGVSAFLAFLREKKYEEMQDAERFADGLLDCYEVRSVAWAGTGNAVVLGAVFKTDTNFKTAVNTPRIKTDLETWGFEEELCDILDSIENEVYEYLFCGKQAQMSLFGQEDE